MNLFLGLVFGGIGSAYLLYAKRQQRVLPLFIGFVLVIYPYFIENAFLIVVIGVCLALVPLAHDRGWF